MGLLQNGRERAIAARAANAAVHEDRRQALLQLISNLYSVDHFISMTRASRHYAATVESNLEKAIAALPEPKAATPEATDRLQERFLDLIGEGKRKAGEKVDESLDHRRAQRVAGNQAMEAAARYGHYPSDTVVVDRGPLREVYELLYILGLWVEDTVEHTARNLLHAYCEDLSSLVVYESACAAAKKAGRKVRVRPKELEVIPTMPDQLLKLRALADQREQGTENP